MRTIILNKDKSKFIDIKKFYEKYDRGTRAYTMLQGTPIIMNIDGRYIELNDLYNLVYKPEDKPTIISYIRAIKQVEIPPEVEFKWRNI